MQIVRQQLNWGANIWLRNKRRHANLKDLRSFCCTQICGRIVVCLCRVRQNERTRSILILHFKHEHPSEHYSSFVHNLFEHDVNIQSDEGSPEKRTNQGVVISRARFGHPTPREAWVPDQSHRAPPWPWRAMTEVWNPCYTTGRF